MARHLRNIKLKIFIIQQHLRYLEIDKNEFLEIISKLK